MDDIAKRFAKLTLVVTISGIVISAFLTVAHGDHFWPFPSKGSLAASYQHVWNGQIPTPDPSASSIQLTLKLGSGGLNEAVGSISSTTLGCAEVVYLAKADDPVTLRLDTSGSSLECRVLSFFNDATISLVNDDLLQFTVDLFGVPESCDLSR